MKIKKSVEAFWRQDADEIGPCAQLLSAKLKGIATTEQMMSELMSTSLAELCIDVTALIVAFADPSRAHVEDLQLLGVTEANWIGLRDSFTFDEEFAEGLYALAGFKEIIVSANEWLPFLKSVAELNAKVLSFFFSKTSRNELLRELFPKEVWSVAFLSNKSMNALGLLVRMDLANNTNYVTKLKEFVGDKFFERLKVTRMRCDMLAIHCAIDLCATEKKKKLPSADFLMSLLPEDTNGLDLSILHPKSGIRWTLHQFAHYIVGEFREDTNRVITEVLRRVESNTAVGFWLQ